MQGNASNKGKLILIGLMGLLYLGWQSMSRKPIVVYCAHDAIFADAILKKFESKSGLKVAVVYDTEATKSLGLAERIQKEAASPQCDVFWNNEQLATQDLAEKGLLQPYQGEGWKRIPPAFRDEEGRWAGFAARLRVTIHKNGVQPPTLFQPKDDLSRFTIAKPLFGTTLTHYSLLYKTWGRKKTQRWHSDLRHLGIIEANGNSGVKQLVMDGKADAGWTDTDDYFDALDAGADVTAEPCRLENGRTICIPNTVALIKGRPDNAAAKKLMDFLLSESTEIALAKSKSRQIPLGPVDEKQLPREVIALKPAAAEGEPLHDLGKARQECLDWLKSIYVQ